MTDDRFHERLLERVREAYHAPPPTPREDLWRAISARLREPAATEAAPVIDLAAARERRSVARRPALWATAAAAALVVLGIGIGRITSPRAQTEAGPVAATPPAAAPLMRPTSREALRLAATEHLGRTESFLTMVRADARAGALNPATAEWARALLAETRLLMDARSEEAPEIGSLLEDLELVLAQIVGVAELEREDGARARTELDMAVRGIENGEVLPRIEAAIPVVQAGA